MLTFDEMPQDNKDLSKVDVEFPHVSLDEVSGPEDIEPHLLDYLEREDYKPDGDLHFLRTALVEKKVYWIWKFECEGEKAYATATQDEDGNTSVGCDLDDYNLSPEQYILGDYHDCF